MLVLLSALNAKFIHSSPALHSLYAYSNFKENILIKEFTINQSKDKIVSEIIKLNPDIVCFSCYIWNIEMIKEITPVIKKIRPSIKIIFGGSEVSFQYEEILQKNIADVIVIGEGEETFEKLMNFFILGEDTLSTIQGIAFMLNGIVQTTSKRTPIPLDSLPFIYKDNLEVFNNKILYYESSRGCPFSCAYCMSSIEKGVRFVPLERVFEELSFFLANKVRQVKFIDRTFNCDSKRAYAIWKFLIDNTNGITNFHFEIAADLLTPELLTLLKEAPNGLFQFEIGVQSTNRDTLQAVMRKSDLSHLFDVVKKLKDFGNIHLHLDLIAGLPEEDYLSFQNSFNEVYNLHPDQLQLGFLKLLKGSALRENAHSLGIVYDEVAPYSVLYTNHISYEEIQVLKQIEDLVDLYYNSGKSLVTLKFAIEHFESPFDFYNAFRKYCEKQEFFSVLHSKQELYIVLFEFLQLELPNLIGEVTDLILFDMLKMENIKNFPYFIPKRESLWRKNKPRTMHIQLFEYDILQYATGKCERLQKRKNFCMFDYSEGIFFEEVLE